jgi:hypothetical protein
MGVVEDKYDCQSFGGLAVIKKILSGMVLSVDSD